MVNLKRAIILIFQQNTPILSPKTKATDVNEHLWDGVQQDPFDIVVVRLDIPAKPPKPRTIITFSRSPPS